MSLLYDAFEPCVRLAQTGAVPDGQGGYTASWETVGEPFNVAFDFQTSLEAKIAEKQGVTGLWNLLVKKEVNLEYHTVIMRQRDGAIFRITSKDDKATPRQAGLNLRLVSAEEWELT